MNIVKNYIELSIYFLLKICLPKEKDEPGSLLLLNTGEIGDLIISSILLENPNCFYSFSNIKFIIKEEYIDLFSSYNGIIKIIGINYNKYKYSLLYKINFLIKIRKYHSETAIQLTAARGIINEEIIHLSGAKEKIALNSFDKYLGKNLCRYFNKNYNSILGINTLNEYEKHIELLSYLQREITPKTKIEFNIGLSFQIKNNTGKNYIVLAPFSSLLNRDWPKEYFIDLINDLKNFNNLVLIGNKRQKSQLKKLAQSDNRIRVLAGDLGLNEIPEFLSKAKCFVGLDSGITHLAIKLKVPTVALIGGGEFGRFFPYKESDNIKFLYHKMDCFNCNWICKKDKMYCLTEIEPRTVKNIISEIINKT